MKQFIKLSRRTFGSILGGALTMYSQLKTKRQAEEEEWADAYDVARRTRSDSPKDGFVPTTAIAQLVAEAVARGLYGEETATSERPFRARLQGSVWTVKGTLNPPGALGGVAIIQIRKDDGRILFAHHTQ